MNVEGSNNYPRETVGNVKAISTLKLDGEPPTSADDAVKRITDNGNFAQKFNIQEFSENFEFVISEKGRLSIFVKTDQTVDDNDWNQILYSLEDRQEVTSLDVQEQYQNRVQKLFDSYLASPKISLSSNIKKAH